MPQHLPDNKHHALGVVAAGDAPTAEEKGVSLNIPSTDTWTTENVEPVEVRESALHVTVQALTYIDDVW